MRRLLFLVIAIAVFLSFFRLGSVSLFDVDEAVFATATKEMVQNSDWITPTYNGANRYDKPILFYWLMAFSYRIFGINEFAARFPSACAGVLLVSAVSLFVMRFRDEKTALYAALSLSFSVYFFLYSHAAVTDMTLALFTALSLMSFYLAFAENTAMGPMQGEGGGGFIEKEPPQKGSRYLYGFYFFSALAFLTKGLIGILFPFGIAVVFLLATEGARGVKKVFSFRGIILFLIISAPWYVAEVMINGEVFVRQFFLKHHFMRYTGVISGHRGPFYYYIPALIAGLFPWIAFLPAGIGKALKEKERLLLFALVWAAFVLLFFSLSTTKLPNYILPAVPAVIILISCGMSEDSRWGRFAHIFIAATALVLGAALLVSDRYLLKSGITETGWTRILAVTMFSMTAGSLYGFVARKRAYAFTSVVTAVFLIVLSLKGLPIASTYMQGTLLKYSLYARERLHDRDLLIAYDINSPSIVFYSGHRVTSAGSPEEIRPLLAGGVNVIAIARAKDVEVLNEIGFHVLEEEGKYAILERRI